MGATCSQNNYTPYKKYPRLIQEFKSGQAFANNLFRLEFQFSTQLDDVWKVQNVTNYAVLSLHERNKTDLIKNKWLYNFVIRENKIMTSLSSDFVLKILHAFQQEAALYNVTEYISGRLSYYMSQNYVFTNEELKYIAASIVLGLEYLSSKNIIHRNLRPENIFITPEGKVKIGGFLYSREHNEAINNCMDSVGTPGYMAPEIIEKQKHDQLLDLYGLGIILYEVATSQKLFTETSPEKLLTKMAIFRVEKKEFPALYSEDLIHLINRLLQFKPKKRIGAGSFDEIKSHKWFANFNWEGLENGKLVPPFIPEFAERETVGNIKKKVDYALIRKPTIQSLFIGYQHGVESISTKGTREFDNEIV